MAGPVSNIMQTLGASPQPPQNPYQNTGFDFPDFETWLGTVIGISIPHSALTVEQRAALYEQWQTARARAMGERAAKESGNQTRNGTPMMGWTVPGSR
jgi:hypothetical protein